MVDLDPDRVCAAAAMQGGQLEHRRLWRYRDGRLRDPRCLFCDKSIVRRGDGWARWLIREEPW